MKNLLMQIADLSVQSGAYERHMGGSCAPGTV